MDDEWQALEHYLRNAHPPEEGHAEPHAPQVTPIVTVEPTAVPVPSVAPRRGRLTTG